LRENKPYEHSVVFDAVAYPAEDQSCSTLIVEAGEDEGVYLASFDIDLIRAYHAREVWTTLIIGLGETPVKKPSTILP
jgi:hypothetical protein